MKEIDNQGSVAIRWISTRFADSTIRIVSKTLIILKRLLFVKVSNLVEIIPRINRCEHPLLLFNDIRGIKTEIFMITWTDKLYPLR